MHLPVSIVPVMAVGLCAMILFAHGVDVGAAVWNSGMKSAGIGMEVRTRRQAVKPGNQGRSGEKNAKGKNAAKPLSFAWPTSGRRIVEGYGERTNPRTGTVTVNPGINIATRSGSAVKAAERGTVSLISWLPSYGTILILQHRDGYRTVYGNLASTSVSKGASVKLGERIGNVAKTSGTVFLHFEVWRDQTRLDPITVLPKK